MDANLLAMLLALAALAAGPAMRSARYALLPPTPQRRQQAGGDLTTLLIVLAAATLAVLYNK